MQKKICYQGLLELSEVQANPEYVAILENEIKLLELRTQKEKEKWEKKHPNGDPLKDAVYQSLTHEWQNADMIAANLNITRQQVISRLSKLVRERLIQKQYQKTQGNMKITVYSLSTDT